MCWRKVYSRTSVGLVLGQRRGRLTGIDPAMVCNGDSTLNEMPLYDLEVHRRDTRQVRQVLNECWPAQAIVVEGMHVEDIF